MPVQERKWTSKAAERLLRMAGSAATVEEAVRAVAGDLLDGLACPPTDLDAVLDALLAKYKLAATVSNPDIPFSGELRQGDYNLEICVSEYQSERRKRWTTAHEIAHVIFETTGPNCPRYGEELERLCEMLAAEILMPHDIFRELAGASSPDLSTIVRLSDRFETSLSATGIRAADLYRVSVFSMEGSAIQWGYGFLTRGGRYLFDDAFEQSVKEAMSGKSGQRLVHVCRNRSPWIPSPWMLEWRCLGPERAFFLMRRATSEGEILERDRHGLYRIHN